MERPGGAWDIKLEDNWENAFVGLLFLYEKGFVFRGNVYVAHEYGNLLYGYMGRATGFGDVTLYWGGGVANQNSISCDEVKEAPLYGDLLEDHEKIEEGYSLFELDYPNYPEVGYNGIPIESGILSLIGDLLLDII